MNGAKPAESSAEPQLPLSEGNEGMNGDAPGPGLSTLLHGPGNGNAGPAGTAPRPQGSTPQARGVSRALRWSLIAADLVLVLLAGWMVAGRGGRPGFWEIALSTLAVGLGAWLACSAVLLRDRDS